MYLIQLLENSYTVMQIGLKPDEIQDAIKPITRTPMARLPFLNHLVILAIAQEKKYQGLFQVCSFLFYHKMYVVCTH